MPERQPALVTPFWVRIATETNLSPGWLLIAFPAVLYPTYLLLEALFGRGLAAAMDFGGDFETRMLPVWATSLGYISMMGVYVARGTLRDLDALRPLLRGGEATYADLRQQLTQFERHRLWIGNLAGFVSGVVLVELAAGRWTQLLAGEWSLRTICIVATSVAFWTVGGAGWVYVIDSARLYSQIGEKRVEIDLLDLAPLSPLTHHGLRLVLLIVLIIAAIAIVLPLPDAAEPSRMIASFTTVFWSLVVAAAPFVLPVRGLRRQIRARKAEELERVRGQIRRDNELVARAGSDSAEAGGRLPGLMVMEKRIESVREWPFDAPTLTRFFLYVAIPLGSWIGGALVERLLGAALD